ncbi:MAG: ATP-NAD kinase [Kiritimatiellaceae bacterium]|nr:ATP-NAD kinase [Kiritimatiellaceae bacterium]
MGCASYSAHMKRVGVIIHPKRARAENTLEVLRSAAVRYKWTLVCDQPAMAERLGASAMAVDSFADEVELVLALGGDGTVLYAAHALMGSKVPVLGINLGSLGFLTAVAEDKLVQALDQVASGNYKLHEREGALATWHSANGQIKEWPALNDVVMGWGGSSRIVKLELEVDQEPVGQFSCDGVIISTATGSTGHALSNGGPIMHPAIRGFGISVICPHTLGSRPMVVPNRSRIEVALLRCHKELLLSVDGQDCRTVQQGDRLIVERYAVPLQMIQLPGNSYFHTLAKKLNWQGSVI